MDRKKNRQGRAITREQALRIAMQILSRAEAQRKEYAVAAAECGIQPAKLD
jgi:hypothetical protein